MTRFSFALVSFFLTLSAVAQLGTNRMRAHYRINECRINKIENKGFKISKKDSLSLHYTLCDLKRFKFLATLKDGMILIDGWSFTTGINTVSEKEKLQDDKICLSKYSPDNLVIDLRRKSLGESTKVVRIPFRSWVITANSLGVKVRPSVTDSAGVKYASNVSTSFNLGFTVGHAFGRTSFTHRTQINWSLIPGIGVGFGSAALSKELLYAPRNVSNAPSNLVISPNGSLTIARNDIGLVLAAGLDVMAGEHADSWLYQNKFFWGFGLAIGLKV